jgi:hypothetical protein
MQTYAAREAAFHQGPARLSSSASKGTLYKLTGQAMFEYTHGMQFLQLIPKYQNTLHDLPGWNHE